MSKPALSLIVTDTSPLIMLALADALDALVRAGNPVGIPDAVYIEATRIRAAPGARVSLISAGDFLRELEATGLIQSADRILDEAAAQGRNVEKQRRAGGEDSARGRLRRQPQTRRDDPQPDR